MLNSKNKRITENKIHRATMVLHTNKTDRLAVMITTRDRITHTIAKTTKTNAPEMIAANHPHKIAPTPRCAAQVITTETEHHSMRKRRNTKIKSTNQKQKHFPSRTTEKKKGTTSNLTTLKSSETARKDKT
jgi:hypothetical protein